MSYKVKSKSSKKGKVKASEIAFKPFVDMLIGIQGNIKRGKPIPTGWVKNWITSSARNGAKGNFYSGINEFILSFNLKDDLFFTYNQAIALGGNVKKGGKGNPIIFWNKFETLSLIHI